MAEMVSVATQTEPNLIDRLIDNQPIKKVEDIDLYEEYLQSAQCSQFWPLDKNPIRSLVPKMVKVDLPEQYLKSESLMFDLVQAITNNSKLVNLLAKYIHHIVPNVIISKRIDLIPLITCTIRVCRDPNEQERLISLLFNLIKRPNEEQRRMILSGIVVVLQVSPHQSSSLLLPNLWEHVSDKFPERRILLAESCATLAHYVRPAMRTKLILSILIQLLKDKNAAVRSAACKSFSCLLTLIMDRNDEVFDACLSATEDIIQDILQQTQVNLCEHQYELEQTRFCALETIFPLLCMWAVKLNRFKVELAEFYLAKADKYFTNLLNQLAGSNNADHHQTSIPSSPTDIRQSSKVAAAAAVARRRSVFFESRHSSSNSSFGGGPNSSGISTASSTSSGGFFSLRRQSAQVVNSPQAEAHANGTMLTSQRAVGAYLKMLNYLVPFVFSDAVYSCAWLSKSNLHNLSVAGALQQQQQQQQQQASSETNTNQESNGSQQTQEQVKTDSSRQPPAHDYERLTADVYLFDRPLKFANKLLEPTLIIDESAIVAFHDQLKQEHMNESLEWILNTFLPKFLSILAQLSHKNFHSVIGPTNDVIQEFLFSSISSTRQLCLLFGKHLTRTKIRPLIKNHILTCKLHSLYSIYIASLTAFEPIEQQEFEEIAVSIRANLGVAELVRQDVEILAISIKIIATNSEQIHSPSTRQKFLTYILDALNSYSNQTIRTTSNQPTTCCGLNGSSGQQVAKLPGGASGKLTAAIKSKKSSVSNGGTRSDQQHQTQTKEFILIIFRHILTCLIDPIARPIDWAHILVTKFLPLLISLANDSADVYVCTYARLMCAQLVETFDTYLNCPKMTRQTADAMLPALVSLKGLTEQIKASNLKRQIDCLVQDLNEKFFYSDDNNNNMPT